MSSSAIVPTPDSETSALFNPAFCAALLNRACTGYEAKADEAMPVVFAFLILPSSLHKPTREALPSTSASSMWRWLRANPVLLMDLADRVRTFRPFTSAALSYGLRHAGLAGSLGTVAAAKIRRRPTTLYPTDDWRACFKAADFLGKWFGGAGADTATILVQWGVRP